MLSAHFKRLRDIYFKPNISFLYTFGVNVDFEHF